MDTLAFAKDRTLPASIPVRSEKAPEVARPYHGQDTMRTHWDSLHALYAFVTEHTRAKDGSVYRTKLDDAEAQQEAGHAWTWGFNTAESLALAARGWPEGAAASGSPLRLANEFLSTHEEPQPAWDVTGATVDVAAYLSGVPECMITFADVKRETRAVRLVIGSFMSGGQDASLYFERGRALMSCVLGLQAAGVAVSVEILLAGRPEGGAAGQWSVTIHNAGDAFDPSRFMFALAHPAFARLILSGAAGLVVGTNEGFKPGLMPEKSPGVVIVPGLELGHKWAGEKHNRKFLQQCIDAAA